MSEFDLLSIDWLMIAKVAVRPLLTLLCWLFCDMMIKRVGKRAKFIDDMFARGSATPEARAASARRTATFRRLFIDLLRVLSALFFGFIFLEAFGVDLKPLLAGVGVVGIGISLAAQNIMRDYLNGFFILIDDQYNVGDFIMLDGAAGFVEEFTLHTTKIRQLDGSLVTIGNGSISKVTNCTKDYSVAVILIGIPYGSDMSEATEALKRSCVRLREKLGGTVKDDGNVQGIVDFRAADVQMRILVKVSPGEQWAVERAMRAIILEELAAVGIRAPIPHVINHFADAFPAAIIKKENTA